MSKQDLKLIIQRITNNSVPEIPVEPNVRIACVAAILRWRPYIPNDSIVTGLPTSPLGLLDEPWVNDCHGEAEILFIQRAVRTGDVWSGDVALPGGKRDPSDRNNLDTAIRECKEEIGLDLGSPDFVFLGTLEHRNIKMPATDKVVMKLIPHVFLQVTPTTPKFTIQVSEVADTQWVSVRYLLSDPIVAYSPLANMVVIPGKSLPWPRSTRVPAIPLAPNSTNGKTPHLWGMTLRMAQETLGMTPSSTIMSAEEAAKYEDHSNAKPKL